MTTDRATARKQAEAILAEFDGIAATAYRDPTPVPVIGPTPPVPQPGRPPMSQKATDASAFMLAAGLATVPPGLIAIGILIASDYADPAVIAMICAAPAAIALPILAIARLLRGAKAVVPDTHNHHYAGPVHQEHRNVSTQTRGIWVRTTNNGS